MAEAVTKGDRFELRVARLLFWEGAFVRRAINLNMHFGEEFTVTDVDILALRFTRDLAVSTSIGECKATEAKSAPKATDRLLWGGGLRTLVGADDNFVVTTRAASERVRRLARQLGSDLLDEHDVAHREAVLHLDDRSSWGPFDPELLVRQRAAHDAVKDDRDLKRVYWFTRSDFWFLQPVAGIKRALGACRVLAGRWAPELPTAERDAVRWLAAQIVVTAIVALVRIAATCYRQPPRVTRARLAEQLAEGLADHRTLTELSREVDRLVMAVLRDAGVDPGRTVGALGALRPAPPGYADSLIDVVERLAGEPAAAAELPRLADWRIAEHQLAHGLGELPAATVEVLDGHTDRLLRTVVAFLKGHGRLPSELVDGLLRPSGDEREVRATIPPVGGSEAAPVEG